MGKPDARTILTDIEGTTTSIAFVTETLFPYARARLAKYIATHAGDLPPIPGDPLTTLSAWMDADAKETALKTVQGAIWASGYADGTLVGHVYPDAAEALRRWQAAGHRLAVFSSGSVAAQKLIFGHSSAGDLSGLFSGWFDTTTGGKREPASYAAIARALGTAPADLLFLSDTPEEVAAARAAGCDALLIDRAHGRGDVASFAEITP